MIGPYNTDVAMTLEQLSGSDWGDPATAPTYMVETAIRSGKKPLRDLYPEEIRLLISQGMGLPFILDLVWPILQRDPLHSFDLYEGDVLASLIKSPEEIWEKRPEYRAELDRLKATALKAPDYMNDMFRETLGLA